MRILIVEDEHRIATSIKKGLEQESYAVDLAFDGMEGFDLALSQEYDVIILDLMLPKMNGLEVCKKLREENVQTPILILTAKDQIEDKVSGLNCGSDDYLSKPFSFVELLARIKALTRRPKNTFKTVLEVGDLTLDTVKFEVKKDGKSIDLSKTEFALLEYLMRNKGKIVSKEKIIDHVWDYDSNVLPNTVEAYIRYLRKKIDKDLIKTVRGFGYKVEERF